MAAGAFFGLHYIAFTAIGYAAGLTNSFILNFHFTFQVNGYILRRMALFFGINLSNLFLTEIVQFVLIEKIHLFRLLAILICMVWYSIIGFILNHKYVFAEISPC